MSRRPLPEPRCLECGATGLPLGDLCRCQACERQAIEGAAQNMKRAEQEALMSRPVWHNRRGEDVIGGRVQRHPGAE